MLIAYDIVNTGELGASTVAVRLPTVACAMVKFKALKTNVGNVYIGNVNVSVPKGNTNAIVGFMLAPGDDSGWIQVSNLNKLYMICDTANDELTYLAVA